MIFLGGDIKTWQFKMMVQLGHNSKVSIDPMIRRNQLGCATTIYILCVTQSISIYFQCIVVSLCAYNDTMKFISFVM